MQEEGGYRICKPIRDMCVFARQNVLADPSIAYLYADEPRDTPFARRYAVREQFPPRPVPDPAVAQLRGQLGDLVRGHPPAP